jgi:hypothetical protein
MPTTWIYLNNYQDLDNFDLYVRSFYFIVTTITTVGFGDITGGNTAEMLFAVTIMIIGVIAFSFATGSLTSIFSSFDKSQAKFKAKLSILDNIKDEYRIGPALYEQLRQSLQYETGKDVSDMINFVNNLPYRLKVELSLKIHREIIKSIPFFNKREK